MFTKSRLLKNILLFLYKVKTLLNKKWVWIKKQKQLFFLFVTSFGSKIFIVKFIVAIIIASYFTYYTYQSNNKSINNLEVNDYIDKQQKFFSQNFKKKQKEEQELLKDVLLINISNDKELISVEDHRNFNKGELAITHRGKLAEFLKLTKNKHKFIFLDVLFFSKYNSKYDSLLFSQLKETKRILIPSFINKDSLIQRELANTGFSGYESTFNNFRFVKYNFIINDTVKSIALKMYEALEKKTIKKNKYIDSSSHKVALSSLILNHRISTVNKYLGEDRGYFELGSDLLDPLMKDAIPSLVNNKIVLIGDFEDRDLHLTSKGIIPGVLINYNAYLALKNNDHIISNSLILFLFVGYLSFMLMSLFGLKKSFSARVKKALTLIPYINKEINIFLTSGFLKLIIPILGILLDTITFLFIWSSLIYIIFNLHLNILFQKEIYLVVIPIIFIFNKYSKSKENA